MGFRRCPGSMAFSRPTIETAVCPGCGAEVEIWSDEASGACPSCGQEVIRAIKQSCVDWCRYAAQCLGEEKYKKYAQMKCSMRKDALLKAAADSIDEARMRRARLAVAEAETLLRGEPQADPNVVIAATVLAAAGIPPGGGDAGPARRILQGLAYPSGFIVEVCGIVERLLAGTAGEPADSANLRVSRKACAPDARRTPGAAGA
jgi:hypothetical protein